MVWSLKENATASRATEVFGWSVPGGGHGMEDQRPVQGVALSQKGR